MSYGMGTRIDYIKIDDEGEVFGSCLLSLVLPAELQNKVKFIVLYIVPQMRKQLHSM
jgi:hypothetical protein